MSEDTVEKVLPDLIKTYDLICCLRDRLIQRGVTPKYLTMNPKIWKIFEEVGFTKRFSTRLAILEVDIREDCPVEVLYVSADRIDEGDNSLWFGATGTIE